MILQTINLKPKQTVTIFKSSLVVLFLLLLTACNKKDVVSPEKKDSNAELSTSVKILYFDSTNFQRSTIDSGSLSNKQSLAKPPIALDRALVTAGTDYSGDVEVAIWSEYADGNHPHVEVSVDPDYVLIGGGAQISGTAPNVNSLLTSSYPIDDGTFSTWAADSKDHYNPNYHRLYVYAIGVRLKIISTNTYVPPAIIKSVMTITKSLSSYTNHPTTISTMPSGDILLSGGSKINWTGYGSLLVDNIVSGYPNWLSSAKDHFYPENSTIESYSISINPFVPQFGSLQGTNVFGASGASNQSGHHVVTATLSSANGYVISGVGGQATYSGYGRMLAQCYPSSAYSGVVYSKDHLKVSSGITFVNVLGIRRL